MRNSKARTGSGNSALPAAPGFKQLLPWLLAVLLAHACLLAPDRLSWSARSTTAPPLQWRLLPANTAAEDTPVAEADSAVLSAPARSARTNTAPPAKAQQTAAAASAAAPASPAKAMTVAQPLPAGQWQYQLRWQGEQGVAQLVWEQDGSRYRLHLSRQTSSKQLPDWRSEGELRAGGLQPLRFTTQRGKRSQLQLAYDPIASTLTAHKQPSTPAPPLTQDRLSWMFQAAALAQAAQLKAGAELQFWVAGWRGDLQPWRLRAERDADHPQWLRLRRLPPEGSLVEQSLWLDPARGYLPTRMEVRWDDAERWELQIDDAPVS